MADFAYLADKTDDEFSEWLAFMNPLVGVPQCRAFKHMRQLEIERRKSVETQEAPRE